MVKRSYYLAGLGLFLLYVIGTSIGLDALVFIPVLLGGAWLIQDLARTT